MLTVWDSDGAAGLRFLAVGAGLGNALPRSEDLQQRAPGPSPLASAPTARAPGTCEASAADPEVPTEGPSPAFPLAALQAGRCHSVPFLGVGPACRARNSRVLGCVGSAGTPLLSERALQCQGPGSESPSRCRLRAGALPPPQGQGMETPPGRGPGVPGPWMVGASSRGPLTASGSPVSPVSTPSPPGPGQAESRNPGEGRSEEENPRFPLWGAAWGGCAFEVGVRGPPSCRQSEPRRGRDVSGRGVKGASQGGPKRGTSAR